MIQQTVAEQVQATFRDLLHPEPVTQAVEKLPETVFQHCLRNPPQDELEEVEEPPVCEHSDDAAGTTERPSRLEMLV